MTPGLPPSGKQLAERLGASSAIQAFGRRRLRDRSLVLAYHNVIPTGVSAPGDRSLHLPLGRFEAQLDFLAASYDVVPLDAITSPPAGARARVAITWDDAYAGAVTLGVEATTRRGLPATIFVCPGRLGGQIFWWDRLGDHFRGMVPQSVRARALDELGGEDDAVLRGFGNPCPESDRLPPFARTASVDELRRAVSRPGITIASHGWSHANLARLEPERLRRELRDSREWVAGFPGGSGAWLSYPYGVTDARVETAAREAGYAAGCLISGGWAPRGGAPRYRWPRRNIPAGMSLEGFACRLAGLLR